MNGEYSIVITTFADKESAGKTARLLVEKRIAACVQLFPVESVYLWEDRVCGENETVLLIKSRTALFDEIVTAIKETHAYEVPEIIQAPITGGLPQYLKWIDDSTFDAFKQSLIDENEKKTVRKPVKNTGIKPWRNPMHT